MDLNPRGNPVTGHLKVGNLMEKQILFGKNSNTTAQR